MLVVNVLHTAVGRVAWFSFGNAGDQERYLAWAEKVAAYEKGGRR